MKIFYYAVIVALLSGCTPN
ncbi:MAG: lipoprotein, partial [Desulfobulbaceae bacterium]|nr:lipoprotein [Desulfobulbaceae bacterium]